MDHRTRRRLGADICLWQTSNSTSPGCSATVHLFQSSIWRKPGVVKRVLRADRRKKREWDRHGARSRGPWRSPGAMQASGEEGVCWPPARALRGGTVRLAGSQVLAHIRLGCAGPSRIEDYGCRQTRRPGLCPILADRFKRSNPCRLGVPAQSGRAPPEPVALQRSRPSARTAPIGRDRSRRSRERRRSAPGQTKGPGSHPASAGEGCQNNKKPAGCAHRFGSAPPSFHMPTGLADGFGQKELAYPERNSPLRLVPPLPAGQGLGRHLFSLQLSL